MNSYTQLARQAIETYIKEEKTISLPKNLPAKMTTTRAGVFVTIKNGEQLRGCIGTYEPTKPNIAKEIIANAIAAATNDYRFSPITTAELPKLSYEISILSEPELVKDISKLDPKKFGVLIKTDLGKTGLLLPDLEGIDTTERQLEAVYQKCDADPEHEKITIYKFTVEKYE
ncbi:AmmeMemoRadiSam system protein A [Patescibacteria group bacterium]|nr:AmmeMemoRadiSam system protein A [Patescibacteria group bacterium]